MRSGIILRQLLAELGLLPSQDAAKRRGMRSASTSCHASPRTGGSFDRPAEKVV